MKKETVRTLMDIQATEPETVTVRLPRLGLELSFHTLSYDRLANIRGTEDAEVNYILASAEDPTLRSKEWYEGRMGCPTPADAIKKLLLPGEIQGIVKRCDRLNGYGVGSVVSVKRPAGSLQSEAIDAALEDLEKN